MAAGLSKPPCITQSRLESNLLDRLLEWRQAVVVQKATILMVLLVLAVGVMILVTVSTIRPISDEAMAARFAKQRPQWEHLISILQTNHGINFFQRHSENRKLLIGTDKAGRTKPMSEIGSSAEWLQLFDLLNLDYVSRCDLEVTAAFRRNGIEDIYPGGYKVIALCSNQPQFIVNSIDDFRRRNRGTYRYYQHLAGPWYIKYEQAF